MDNVRDRRCAASPSKLSDFNRQEGETKHVTKQHKMDSASLRAGGRTTCRASSSVPAIADEPELDAPIALVGQIDGASLDGAQIHVDLWPRDEVEKQIKVGQREPTHAVSVSHITIDGSTFTVRLRPEDVPKGFINDDGRVHFSIYVINSNNSTAGFTEKTLKVFRPESTGQHAWIDASSALAENVDAAVAHDGVLAEPWQARLNMRAVKRSRLNPTSTTSCPIRGGWVLVQSTSSERSPYDRWGVLGKTYVPTGTKSTAYAYNSSERSNTFGSAYSAGTGVSYKAEGSRTYSFGNSFTWAASHRPYMEYRARVRYGKYQYRIETSDGCYRGADRIWKARHNTGGYKIHTSSYQPTWRRECVEVPSGQWKRQRTDGRNYSWSIGLKFESYIGIDLKAVRAYTSSSYIAYNVYGKKKLCGYDEVPSRASLVRMAKTW